MLVDLDKRHLNNAAMSSTLAARIKTIRKALKLTQEDFGALFDVSKAAVAQWEAGDPEKRTAPTRDKLMAMAAHGRVSIDWLLSDESDTQLTPSATYARPVANPLVAQESGMGMYPVAHPLSLQPFETPPILTWGEVMQSKELPEVFIVAMPDDSMAPRIERGTHLIFATTDQPSPGKGILVRSRDGQVYVRRYRQGRGNAWHAHAINEADFQTLDSETDGLVVLATLRGVMSGRL